MTARLNHFEMKLLTASKEIGLRRLRSYAAAMGGSAQIFYALDDLKKQLDSQSPAARTDIILSHNTLEIPRAALNELDRKSRVFLIDCPQSGGKLPNHDALAWRFESYFHCSMHAFFESPIVRMGMAQMCRPDAPLHLAHLLRWGHAASVWTAGTQRSIADHGVDFVKSLSLVGESRRLAEMSSHFLQVHLPRHRLLEQEVTFGADGLLTMVIARCQKTPETNLVAMVADLVLHEFPISIINCIDQTTLEIAALYYPFASPEIVKERVLMIFNKRSEALAIKAAPLDKVG